MAGDYRTWASAARDHTGKAVVSLGTADSCSKAALASGRQQVIAELVSHRMTE